MLTGRILLEMEKREQALRGRAVEWKGSRMDEVWASGTFVAYCGDKAIVEIAPNRTRLVSEYLMRWARI